MLGTRSPNGNAGEQPARPEMLVRLARQFADRVVGMIVIVPTWQLPSLPRMINWCVPAIRLNTFGAYWAVNPLGLLELVVPLPRQESVWLVTPVVTGTSQIISGSVGCASTLTNNEL